MDDLVTWLRAQLDEDEQVAKQVMAEPGGFYIEAETADVNIMTIGALVYRWTPKRVLVEVDAKRRMLDLHEIASEPLSGRPVCRRCIEAPTGGMDWDWPCLTVRLLALPYADREEWRP